MKQIVLICLVIVLSIQAKGNEKMKISVQSNKNITIFQLNDSSASKEFYEQLPLTIEVNDFSDNEKIFYPSEKLSTKNTPLANKKNGTLAYYAPWGNIVMFYKDFKKVNGLFELGEAMEGIEYIRNISGTVQIKKLN